MADNEIISSRILNASAAKVYEWFTNPGLLKKWWGPDGFTNTIHEFDLKPGGKWTMTMHGPDQTDYLNESEFVTIIPTKLVGWKRFSKPLFDMEVLFDALDDNQTNFTFRMIFGTAKECENIRPFVAPKNEENFDRLERELNTASK